MAAKICPYLVALPSLLFPKAALPLGKEQSSLKSASRIPPACPTLQHSLLQACRDASRSHTFSSSRCWRLAPPPSAC